MNNMKKLETGSYLTGTLNPRDLTTLAIDMLTAIQMDTGFNLDKPENRLLREATANILGEFMDSVDDSGEINYEPWPDLWDAFVDFLELHFVPDNHYFGAHPGDGSDIGVWPLEDYDSED